MGLFKKIYLLVWKNFLFRKKHLCATAWLILLPTSIYMTIGLFMSYARSQSPPPDSKGPTNERTPRIDTPDTNIFNISNNDTAFTQSFIEPLIRSNGGIKIAYAPGTYITEPIMMSLKTTLEGINKLPKKDFFVQLFPYKSNEQLENDMHSWKTNNNPPNFTAAIIFQDKLTLTGVYSYTIRMKGIDFYTDLLIHNSNSKTRYRNGHSSESPQIQYPKAGFRTLQILLDKIIVQKKVERAVIPVPKVALQKFPEITTKKDLISTLRNFVIHLFILSFILSVPNIIRGIIHEKQSGIKELMKMMGLSNWMHWTGWTIDCLFLLATILSLITFFLFVPFFGVSALTNCSFTLWFFMLMLYFTASVTSLFFVSTFFGKPTIAVIAGICFYIVSYYGLVFIVDSGDVFESTLAKKLASSLFPNMALHWFLKIMLEREFNDIPTGWSSITEPFSLVDRINILAVGGMLVADVILYMLLTLYLESVIPSEFGRTKPWYYPFLLSTWYSPNRVMPLESDNSLKNTEGTAANPKTGFEEEPTDLKVGIEICNLSKRFENKKVAVDGLSAKMYAGEITALLGHNGAGKTTALSILTGLYKPSGGTAYINGYNIAHQIGEIRKSVGLCPQHDLLFGELTVAQHLQFFGMLKGLSSSMARQESQDILYRLKLGEKSSNMASTLSGGQKRRLSLANSIVGKASVLFLDEPTSGLDPEARREVWDMLLALRTEERTIVLTTHFMEEADVLGDRILIMAEGKLQCSGTPLFLKKCFGDGYTLTVTLTDKADRNSILFVVQKYISTASFKKGETKSVSEVAITLPEESTETSIFPDLFSDLTKHKKKLGILTMGLTIPSMDDVFLRVGELSHPTDDLDIAAKEKDTFNRDNTKGCSLIILMFWGLMIKLLIRNIRNRRLIFLQLLPSILAVILVSLLSIGLFDSHIHDYPPLKISLKSYGEPITLCMPMTTEADDMCKYFFQTTEGIGTTILVRPGRFPRMFDYLNAEKDNNAEKFEYKYVIAAEMEKNGDSIANMSITVLHSGTYAHSEPLALNAASNTILKIVANSKSRPLNTKVARKIEIINHPLRTKDPIDVIEAAETRFGNSWQIIVMFVMLLPLPFAMLAASYLVFPSEERVSKGKHLQAMTGVGPPLYWLTTFLSDFLMMTFVTCLILICFLIVQPHELYTGGNGAGVIFLIFMTYSFSVMPISYLRSNFGETPSEGFSGLVILHSLTALILANMAYVFEYIGGVTYPLRAGLIEADPDALAFANGMYTAGNVLRIISIANPTFGLTMCLIKFAAISIENNRCKLLGSGMSVICRTHPNAFSYLKSCCKPCFDGSAECGTIDHCYGKIPFLTWKSESDFPLYILKSPSTPIPCNKEGKLAGIGQELFWMFLFGVIYYILLFMVDFGIFAQIKQKLRPQKSLVEFQANYPTDEDVIAEAERVHATVFRPKTQLADRSYPITDSEQMASEEIDPEDQNYAAMKSDEQQKRSDFPVNDTEGPVKIQIDQDSLVVQNLCKSYKSFAAVSNISFGVKHGECFGLLGVNGAGKTTTFRMLIGDEVLSDGDAIAGGFSLKNDKNNFIRQFGYCPQFDPLIPFMTGREMLNFYGRLRGVPPASLKRETSKWLNKLGLTDAGNAQCKTYSGGMKRRLSAGLGLIGNPPIILLDEPTSGVDPVCRRQFWKIISSVKDAGQAVIFTSHSMDECEALCSRLGIMVNGQFQCFGGAPHIKAKFGEGYSLFIKLKSNIPVDNPEDGIEKILDNSKAFTDLQEEIFAKYQKVFLKEVHTNIMQYQLLDGSMTWDVVFKIMEEIKTKHEIIDHYSIGETTLEQVFLTFARNQYGGRAI